MIVASVVGFFRRILGHERVPKIEGSIFDLEMDLLNGEKVQLDRFRGKKLLIVNTASRCGFTYQYDDLQRLHETYGDRVQVLGFPSNDFFQDGASNDKIADFCRVNYGVTFPVFKKVHVTGTKAHPLFRLLYSQCEKFPVWNFCKYLVNENGKVIGFFNSRVRPFDQQIISKITNG